MKILKPFFALFLFLSFVACDSDDEEITAVNAQSIIGSWSLDELEANADFTTQVEGIPFTGNVQSVGENFDFTLIFTETTYSVEGSYDLVTTGTVNGLPIDTDRQSITDISETGTYTLNDDGTIEFDGTVFDLGSVDTEITEVLDDQVLTVAFDDNGNLVLTQNIETTVEEQGIELSTTGDARIVLSPL